MTKPSARDDRPRAHVALFEATSLSARGIKEQLVARSFPTASVHLYTTRTDPDSNLTEFGDEAMLVTRPDIEALGPLDIAFLCGTREEGERYLAWADRVGFVAIDVSGASRGSDAIPMINVAVNPESIPAHHGVVASPHPIAQFLSTLLAPLQRAFRSVRAAAVVLQPASECGERGIEELYQQTLGLLNFREVPNTTFGRQLAFNLLPSSLYEVRSIPGGASPADLEAEVTRITGEGLRLAVEVVLAPVFHCHSALVHLELPAGTGRESLEAALRGAREIRIATASDPNTPVDRAGEAGLSINGIRPAGADGAFWMWAVTDNLKSGSALNAVRIAEAILDRKVLAAH